MISENQDQYGTRSRSKIKITDCDLDHGKDQDQWNDLDLLRTMINDLIQLWATPTFNSKTSVASLSSSPPLSEVVQWRGFLELHALCAG